MGLGKSGGAVVSVGWTAIEIAYQYGQRSEVASWIIPRLPGFVYQVWPLDHLVRYLGRGGYNSNDVFAAILGGLFAYVAVLNSIPGRRRPRRD
jgi:hypothetical protein